MNTSTFLATDFLLAVRAARQDPFPTLVGHDMPSLPLLEEVISMLSPLPDESAFLGLASDGLPLLLNLFDPAPGSVMVLGDAGAGKTAFLKVIARALALSHKPARADYAVISPLPHEWEGWNTQPNCMGIWPSSSRETGDLLFDLAAWAQRPEKDGAKILLIDDMSSLAHLEREELETLYWLFRFGPQGRVWPLVTLNAGFSRELPNWVTMFRTRIFGRVKDPLLEDELAWLPDSRLGSLLPGAQFAMREKSQWLRFWLPLVVDETNRKFA
jgi:hypothetical protein